MKTTIIKPQIRRGRPEINVPNSGGFITFLYDKYGPDTYANVQNSIEQEGLEAPTIAQTTSLLHQMYYSELKDTKEEIREYLRSFSLLGDEWKVIHSEEIDDDRIKVMVESRGAF